MHAGPVDRQSQKFSLGRVFMIQKACACSGISLRSPSSLENMSFMRGLAGLTYGSVFPAAMRSRLVAAATGHVDLSPVRNSKIGRSTALAKAC